MKKSYFIKCHGLGNDFVIFLENNHFKITEKLIKNLSNRKKGIGCDLVVFLKNSEEDYSDLETRFFNKDGSEAEICGNALRCIGKYFLDKLKKNNATIETKAGLIDIEKISNKLIAVDIGKPNLKWEKIPLSMDIETSNLGLNFNYLKGGFAVNVGNPHVIFFVKKIDKNKLEVDAKEIKDIGLFPEGVNISAVNVVSAQEINVLTFERGVGITSACGTGAGASAYASYKLKHCINKITVCMNGGNLDVEITKDDHILTIGESKEVFRGEISVEDYL